MVTANGFFSRAHELEFFLTKMSGATQQAALGIERIHYVNRDRAQQWHDALLTEMDNVSQEAKDALAQILRQMQGTS